MVTEATASYIAPSRTDRTCLHRLATASSASISARPGNLWSNPLRKMPSAAKKDIPDA